MQLSKLLQNSGSRNARGNVRSQGRSVPVKYLNPKNRLEGWSGRGRMRLWLVAETKAGKDREEYWLKVQMHKEAAPWPLLSGCAACE